MTIRPSESICEVEGSLATHTPRQHPQGTPITTYAG